MKAKDEYRDRKIKGEEGWCDGYNKGFKAGMEEEAKGGHNAISYLEGKKVGEKLGMDKVVELVGKEPFEHNYSMSEHHIDDCFACKYEAKLKEWGI